MLTIFRTNVRFCLPLRPPHTRPPPATVRPTTAPHVPSTPPAKLPRPPPNTPTHCLALPTSAHQTSPPLPQIRPLQHPPSPQRPPCPSTARTGDKERISLPDPRPAPSPRRRSRDRPRRGLARDVRRFPTGAGVGLPPTPHGPSLQKLASAASTSSPPPPTTTSAQPAIRDALSHPHARWAT